MEYMEKFLTREVEIVKGLKHPNMVTFLEAIETTHRVYIIMDYVENGSLIDVIRENIYIDEIIAKKWFKQLINVLHYCHKKDIAHRDIKCENILMDSYYNVQLCDFGFARHMRTPDGEYIYSETFCGSYAYASPEILNGIPYQPHLSDAWSCGVVLYTMIFGQLPFDDSSWTTLVQQISEKIKFPSEPTVSSECKKLIRRILAPLEKRLTISKILNNKWFEIPEYKDITWYYHKFFDERNTKYYVLDFIYFQERFLQNTWKL